MAKHSLSSKCLLIFCAVAIGAMIILGGIVSANTSQLKRKNLSVEKSLKPLIQEILNKSIQENISQSKKRNKMGAISSCSSVLISTKLGFLGDGNNVRVIAKEKRSCAYKIGGPLEEGVYTHVFEFRKNKDEEWVLRKFEDGSKFKIRPLTDEEKKLPLVPSPEKIIKEQKSVVRSNKAKILSNLYTYNRNDAAWYGQYYALSPNTNFRHFEEDCTNFISQAIWYGGWTWVGWWPNKYSALVWWYSFNNWQGQSWTWTSAQYWWWFTYDRPRGYLTDNFCNLQKGDIVQADWNQDGHVDHSMIVTYKNNCDVRVSYHTNNTRNKSIWDIYYSYPNAWYYSWRLYDHEN